MLLQEELAGESELLAQAEPPLVLEGALVRSQIPFLLLVSFLLCSCRVQALRELLDLFFF